MGYQVKIAEVRYYSYFKSGRLVLFIEFKAMQRKRGLHSSPTIGSSMF